MPCHLAECVVLGGSRRPRPPTQPHTHTHAPTPRPQVLDTLKDPLQTLIQGREPEVVYAVLCNFLVLAQRYPLAFSQAGARGAALGAGSCRALAALGRGEHQPRPAPPFLAFCSRLRARSLPAPLCYAWSLLQLYPEFFCRYEDPSYLKALKVEVLIAIADHTNAYEIAEELTQAGAPLPVRLPGRPQHRLSAGPASSSITILIGRFL